MRYAPVAMCLLALCLVSSIAFAGSNPSITLPLHGKAGQSGSCAAGLTAVNCLPPPGGLRPRVNVLASEVLRIYVLMANYTAVAGVQTAFNWDAGWVFDDGPFMTCRANEVPGDLPNPADPGGPITGSFVLAFDCVTTGTVAVLGRMDFTSGTSGCLYQIQSGYPFGTHAQDCSNGRDLIPDGARLGKICVGQGGVDACDPVSAVESATWGSIKASYK